MLLMDSPFCARNLLRLVEAHNRIGGWLSGQGKSYQPADVPRDVRQAARSLQALAAPVPANLGHLQPLLELHAKLRQW